MRCSFAQGGETALHYAVESGRHSIVGMLLAADTDTNAENIVSDARLLPPPLSTIGPLTLGRQAQQLNMQACVCGVRREQWCDIPLQCSDET
jgi:hypothetical protein